MTERTEDENTPEAASNGARFDRFRQHIGALFARRIGEDGLGRMSLAAAGESVACLNCLMYRGEVKHELHDDGMYWYLRT
ncbi:hypothetical protein [Paraburkholderia silvatlantica]|uniref:Uncharacterized protein n=1 Tax=Paraburkholderia silvatlantica TaxID=321895 RepID=A0ABR6FPR4_9BURK|nr:hypothetical protein [Paraburkholderia silvatlantica]MBB2928604.1 hypothetical protein [Paraburkholderia silvatlantica]PVY16199.1 hypothetical protein C7411_1522 [Paraburkholderia silvatlantica]PXW23239.1 hypothetical protein C7413_1562 [Paraburkholderia silvatlantica]TDQ99583.1 hypothetical protein C7412_103374 [Paraburkholderia silvatlantica]